jgi:hypothetical protein
MAAIQHLCSRVVMLMAGRVHADGPAARVVGEYLSKANRAQSVALDGWNDRITTGEVRITKVEIGNDAAGVGSIAVGGELTVRIHAIVNEPLTDPAFGVLIHDSMGGPLLDLRSLHDGMRLGRVTGQLLVEVRVPEIGLYPGRYFLSPWIADSVCSRDIDFPHLSCTLDVKPAPGKDGDLRLNPVWGKYHVRSRWSASLP